MGQEDDVIRLPRIHGLIAQNVSGNECLVDGVTYLVFYHWLRVSTAIINAVINLPFLP